MKKKKDIEFSIKSMSKENVMAILRDSNCSVNEQVYDRNAEAGTFTRKLISLMKMIMRRNNNGAK